MTYWFMRYLSGQWVPHCEFVKDHKLKAFMTSVSAIYSVKKDAYKRA